MNLDNSEGELDGLEIGLAVQEDLGGQLEQLSFRSLAGPRPARKHQNQHRSLFTSHTNCQFRVGYRMK
jgi:hypothetical protein